MSKKIVKTEIAQAIPSIVALPEFDSGAVAIIKAHELFDKASAKLTDTVMFVMQSYIDQCNNAGVAKDEASVTQLGAMIRESQPVLDIVAAGSMERKTFTEYANSAMRAFFYGVPYEAGLKNKPAFILPWGGAKGTKGTKGNTGNTGTKATRAELDKTISKALEQARALGLTEFAAEMLDLCIDRLDNFKE